MVYRKHYEKVEDEENGEYQKMKLETIKKSFKVGDYVQICLPKGQSFKGKIFGFGQFGEESILLESCVWLFTKHIKSIEKMEEK